MDSHSWTAQIALSSRADWQRFVIGDRFDIDLNGVLYSLYVSSKHLQRPAPRQALPVIKATSPIAKLGWRDAERITRTWTTAVTAKNAVEEVLNQTVDWQIVDWTIEANRLAFTDATPLEIARKIISTAGGVLRSNPDGSVKAVKRYPVRVPEWKSATPDHVLSDYVDNVRITEENQPLEIVNQILISSETSTIQQMQIQVDSRPEGLNQGKLTFTPGDSVGVLVFVPDGVSPELPTSSSGTVHIEADQIFEHTENIHFSGTDSTFLTYPASSIKNALWLGNDLGVIGLDSDRRTARITSPGVGVCQLTYEVKAKAYRIATKQTVGGLSEYPVQLHIEADGASASSQRSIIGKRGDGDKPGVDISDPILTDMNALMQRATMELDEGSGLQPVSLQCIYRDGFESGQIVSIDEADQLTNTNGMIRNITHTYNGIKALTSLDILRP